MATGLSLYRRYRPRVFADVVGQDSVTRGLLGSLRSGAVSHAYLFTGPRGSGKTTTARLLAKALNCGVASAGSAGASGTGEPCNVCELCVLANEGRLMDIVELDAASNRGIDEIRQLREQVAFSPAQGRYKTYILDEVHMLTKDAANAFLKTLEEPPPHVVFVLATTEAHKVMATIASRCQRYDFQRVSGGAAAARIGQVLEAEKLSGVSAEAVDEIVRRGDGSMRDMLGLLEQVLSLTGPGFSADDVRRALGLARAQQLAELGAALGGREPARILGLLAALHDQGLEPHVILGQVTEWLRDLLASRVVGAGGAEAPDALSPGRLIAILSRLSALVPQVRNALDPRLTLEIGLLDAAHAELFAGAEATLRRVEELARQVVELQARVASGPGAPAVSSPREPAEGASGSKGGAPAYKDDGAAREAVEPVAAATGSSSAATATAAARARTPVKAARAPEAATSEVVAAAPAIAASAARQAVAPPAPELAAEEPMRMPSFHAAAPPLPLPGVAEGPAGSVSEGVLWERVLEGLKRESPKTHAFAVEGRPLPLAGKKFRLVFTRTYDFHRSRLGEPDHAALLRKHVKEHFGSGVVVAVEEDTSPEGQARADELPDRDWADRRMREDKNVKLVLETFDGEVTRTE